mmetsp:Transcript_165778/g.532337  ORF Transcript_165778/g.532337 Transcript_165778/m.532337 type:complete len:351 (+) Transcript_165778:67-1119(+)
MAEDEVALGVSRAAEEGGFAFAVTQTIEDDGALAKVALEGPQAIEQGGGLALAVVVQAGEEEGSPLGDRSCGRTPAAADISAANPCDWDEHGADAVGSRLCDADLQCCGSGQPFAATGVGGSRAAEGVVAAACLAGGHGQGGKGEEEKGEEGDSDVKEEQVKQKKKSKGRRGGWRLGAGAGRECDLGLVPCAAEGGETSSDPRGVGLGGDERRSGGHRGGSGTTSNREKARAKAAAASTPERAPGGDRWWGFRQYAGGGCACGVCRGVFETRVFTCLVSAGRNRRWPEFSSLCDCESESESESSWDDTVPFDWVCSSCNEAHHFLEMMCANCSAPLPSDLAEIYKEMSGG